MLKTVVLLNIFVEIVILNRV